MICRKYINNLKDLDNINKNNILQTKLIDGTKVFAISEPDYNELVGQYKIRFNEEMELMKDSLNNMASRLESFSFTSKGTKKDLIRRLMISREITEEKDREIKHLNRRCSHLSVENEKLNTIKNTFL